MSDIVDRLNDSLSAGYSELRKEAAQEILQLRKERDALQAKVDAMEKQEPVRHEFQDRNGTWHPFIDQRHYKNTVADESWPIRALYLAPGAQPAPSVPEDVMRDDARRYLWLRNAALDWYVGPEYATYNDVVCSGEYCNYAGRGVALDSAIDALLAAAPESKP